MHPRDSYRSSTPDGFAFDGESGVTSVQRQWQACAGRRDIAERTAAPIAGWT